MAVALQEAVEYTPTFWREVGVGSVRRTREHIFVDGKDVKGKRFRAYAPAKAGQESYISKKLAGKLPRTATNLVSSKVNLINTSDFMRDLQIIGSPTRKGVIIGWPAEGGKVRVANDTGREVSTSRDPIPLSVRKWIDREIDKHTRRVFAKRKDKNYKIGK